MILFGSSESDEVIIRETGLSASILLGVFETECSRKALCGLCMWFMSLIGWSSKTVRLSQLLSSILPTQVRTSQEMFRASGTVIRSKLTTTLHKAHPSLFSCFQLPLSQYFFSSLACHISFMPRSGLYTVAAAVTGSSLPTLVEVFFVCPLSLVARLLLHSK